MTKILDKADLVGSVITGDGMKYARRPQVYLGSVKNGFKEGDLLDANAIIDLNGGSSSSSGSDLDGIQEQIDKLVQTDTSLQDQITSSETEIKTNSDNIIQIKTDLDAVSKDLEQTDINVDDLLAYCFPISLRAYGSYNECSTATNTEVERTVSAQTIRTKSGSTTYPQNKITGTTTYKGYDGSTSLTPLSLTSTDGNLYYNKQTYNKFGSYTHRFTSVVNNNTLTDSCTINILHPFYSWTSLTNYSTLYKNVSYFTSIGSYKYTFSDSDNKTGYKYLYVAIPKQWNITGIRTTDFMGNTVDYDITKLEDNDIVSLYRTVKNDFQNLPVSMSLIGNGSL